MRTGLGSLVLVATPHHLRRHVLGRNRTLTGGFNEFSVSAVERAARRLTVRVDVAAFVNESAQRVRFSAVPLHRLGDDGWRTQTPLLPCLATLQCPVEDAGKFGAQLVEQVTILLISRNLDCEGDQLQSPPVRSLSLASLKWLPWVVSFIIAARTPRKRATSFGMP